MDTTEIISTLYISAGNLAVSCLGITVFLCFFNYQKLKLPFRRLFYFLIWNLFIEILARSFTYSGINNLPLLHIYTLGEFILFSWFYKSLLAKPISFQRNFWYFVITGSLFIIFNSLFFQTRYNPIAKTIVQVTIIAYAVLYFYNLTENQTLSNKRAKSLRLINSAVIIYYSGSLFIFMCSQILADYPDWIKPFWSFNAVLNLIFQLLILWGIWKVVSRKTPLSS